MGNVGPDAAFDVESSVAIYQEVVYVANSAGLIQGWKLDGLDDGKEPTKVFEWWIGDDVDATIVIDDAGKLYVAALHKLDTKQGQVMGQLIKLDPTLQMPVVWSAFTARRDGAPQDIIATPAIWQSVIIVSTFQGDILGFDLETGKELWRVAGEVTQLPSPVVFDQRLLQADCDGNLRAYNIGDGRKMPKLRWTMSIGQCIEATPALWNDWIVVGDRAGYIYGIGTEK
jgi:outer membrane protein assembly factor BamB